MTENDIIRHYRRNGLPFGAKQRKKEVICLSELTLKTRKEIMLILQKQFSVKDLPKIKTANA